MSKHTCRDGKWIKGSVFTYSQLDEAGADGDFVTSQAKTDMPTLVIADDRSQPTMKTGLIHRIHYRLNPTNPVTYTLRLWRYRSAADYQSNSFMLWESPPLQADDTDYDRAELVVPFWLYAPGLMYYSIEWTGAPGVTSGFIDVSGVEVE